MYRKPCFIIEISAKFELILSYINYRTCVGKPAATYE